MELFYRGDGFAIKKENEKYYINWPGGPYGQEVIFEISKENAEKAMKSQKDASAVMLYAETGRHQTDYEYDAKTYERTGKWPSEESEKIYIQKTIERGYKSPNSLITNPKKQQYYTEEELRYLLKKVKREYLDDDGNKELDRLLEKLGE